MSYCRFADDCDVYAYQKAPDEFVVHAAANTVPALPEDQADGMSIYDLFEFNKKHVQPIGGRFDGQTFVEESPRAVFSRLRDLATVGYRVPPHVWENILQVHPEIELGQSTPAPRPSSRPSP